MLYWKHIQEMIDWENPCYFHTRKIYKYDETCYIYWFITLICISLGRTHLNTNPYPLSLFLGAACSTNPMTSVWHDGELGDMATYLVSVMLPEWWSSEKRDKRRDCDIAFPAQSSVSHFRGQQRRSLAVRSSQHLSSLCSSMITKSRVNWPFCLRRVAEWHVWLI